MINIYKNKIITTQRCRVRKLRLEQYEEARYGGRCPKAKESSPRAGHGGTLGLQDTTQLLTAYLLDEHDHRKNITNLQCRGCSQKHRKIECI